MGKTQLCGCKGHTLLLVSIAPGMFSAELDGAIADAALSDIFELLDMDSNKSLWIVVIHLLVPV